MAGFRGIGGQHWEKTEKSELFKSDGLKFGVEEQHWEKTENTELFKVKAS